MWNFQKGRFILAIALFSCNFLVGQTSDQNTVKDNSPFSRLGIGDLNGVVEGNLRNMGHLSAAQKSNNLANFNNPASLTYLKSTAISINGFAKFNTLSSTSQSSKVQSGNIKGMSVAFPLRNPINLELDKVKPMIDWSAGFQLAQYSTVGYQIRKETKINQEDVIGYRNDIYGRGGTYKFEAAVGGKYNNFSFGVKAGKLFGNILQENNLYIQDTTILAGYNNKELNSVGINGFVSSIGLMYEHLLEKKLEKNVDVAQKSIIFGVYVNTQGNLNTNSDRLFIRKSNKYGSVQDTLDSYENLEGDMTIPVEIGAGVTYEVFNKLKLGVEYFSSPWSKYESVAKPEILFDSYRFSFGGEILPNATSYNRYAQRIAYQFGAYYEKDPRKFNTQLTTMAVTFGVTMPVLLPRQKKSYAYIGVELGQTNDKDFLKNTFFNLNLGFTLNDNSWFFKRKFD